MLLWLLLSCSDLHDSFPQDPMEMALTPEDGAGSVVQGFISPDLKTWKPMLPMEGLASCTRLGLVRHPEGGWLLCVEERTPMGHQP